MSLTLERRSFKEIISPRAQGLTHTQTGLGNPNSIEKPSTRRGWKELVFVNDQTDEDPNFCTTRYVDTDGTELWHKNHGATVRGVAIDSSGNTYEAGHESTSFGPTGITLRKRNASGNLLWTKKHGADLYCCALCPDGIVVGGAAGTGGATVRKYAADGTLSWSLATAASVIEIAADSGGNIAALDNPADVWDRGLYAIAANGTLLETVYHGVFVSNDRYNYPSGIAFTGVAEANTGHFDDAFSLYINAYGFHLTLGYITRNVGYVWGPSDGYPDATYGTGLGDIFTHSAAAMPADFLPMFGPVFRSTMRGFLGYARALDSGTYVNTRIVTGPESWDDIGGGLGLCSQAGYIWVAGVSLFRYSEILPHPSTGRWWSEFPNWTLPHHAVIYSCDANASNVAVLGGAIATP